MTTASPDAVVLSEVTGLATVDTLIYLPVKWKGRVLGSERLRELMEVKMNLLNKRKDISQEQRSE